MNTVEELLQGAGLALNPEKCVSFVGSLADLAPASVLVSGRFLTPVASLDILGVEFCFPGGYYQSSSRMDS